MTREQVNLKVIEAEKQGYIWVKDYDKEIVKIELDENSFDKKHRCWYTKSTGGFILPIRARDYSKNIWLGWSLTKEELEKC